MNHKNVSVNPRIVISLFTTVMLAAVVLLSFMTRLEAQDIARARSERESKSVNVVITDANKNPLEAARVTLTTGCPCEPCKEQKVECWIYCCSPGKFSPVTLANDTTGDSGVFELEVGQLPPGAYTIKVESGQLTKDVDIKVDQNHKVKLIKGPGVFKVETLDKALQVSLSMVAPG